MLGRNGNIAYVRYDSHGRIVPGGPIISAQRPKVGFWQPVSYAIGTSVTSNSLRAFIRIDAYGRVVPSSLLLLAGAPSTADSGTSWLEINATYIPYVPTTTTTTTIIPTTTTTTTAVSAGCALGAVVNPTFPGGPVSCTIEQICEGDVQPYFLLSNPIGGSGEYCFLTTSGAILLEYETAISYATLPFDLPVWPNTLSKLFYPGWPAGKQFWVVFADANDLNNKIVFPIVVVQCPPIPSSNTVFMKFDIL